MILEYTIFIICSYLLGSIPFGFIAAKRLKGIDITQHGSGNIGATNIMRSIGAGPAAVVFILDILKGFIPVILVKTLLPASPDWFIVLCGIMAIIGHCLSIFLRFRGGKGAATSLGVIIGLNPLIAVISFGIFIIVLAIFKYVSLASIITAVAVPVLMVLFRQSTAFIIFAAFTGLFVILKHKANIGRLIKGNEAKWGEKSKA